MSHEDYRRTLQDIPTLDQVMNDEIAALLSRRSALSPPEVALFGQIFGHLMASYVDLVWSATREHRLSSEETAHCVQETFVRFYKSVVAKGFPESSPGLLHQMAHRKASNLVRSRGLEPMTEAYPSSGSEKPVTGRSVESLVRDSELARRLFEELTPDHQTIVRLSILEERPDQEIAELLRLPLGTVKSRIAAAKRALAALFTKHVPGSGQT